MWEVSPHMGTRWKQQASPKHCHPNNNKAEIWVHPSVTFSGMIWHSERKRMKREKFRRFPFEPEDIDALMNNRRFCEP